MRRLLTATAAAALLGGPAMGQMGGGDGAQNDPVCAEFCRLLQMVCLFSCFEITIV